MWKILQQKKPDDYVLATGRQHSVKEFANMALQELGIKFFWKGSGINEKCYNNSGKVLIECDPAYYRPLEVDTLLGNAAKARRVLNWKPRTNLKTLVKEMVKEELNKLNAKKK